MPVPPRILSSSTLYAWTWRAPMIVWQGLFFVGLLPPTIPLIIMAVAMRRQTL